MNEDAFLVFASHLFGEAIQAFAFYLIAYVLAGLLRRKRPPGEESKRFAQLVPDGETKRPTRLILRRSSAYRWLSAYLPPVFVSAEIPEYIHIVYKTLRKIWQNVRLLHN